MRFSSAVEDQVGGSHLCMESNMITWILVPGQFDHSFDECFQIKQRRPGVGILV